MVSEQLEVQVLVRALYDFESDDATNLSFKKDDMIHVLAQLESGWWAGHCDGRQGWFPSNYVQVLGEDDLDSQDEDEDVDDLEGGDDVWLPQTTPDGQVFYYNQRTGESSWTIPDTEDQASTHSIGTTDTAGQDSAGRTRWSVRQSTSNGNGWYTSEVEDDDQDDQDDSHADVADIATQSNGEARSRLSRSSSTHSSLNNKTTASSTDATSTAGSSADPALTVASARKPSGLAPPVPLDPVDGLPPLPVLPNPFDPEPTWDSLLDHITAAVENLISSADDGHKPYYLIQSSIVVEAIRVMLYASGTVDKDAVVMRQHRALKLHHRQIMASLSKLVLSAKMASGVWSPPDAVAKLQADAKEVKTASQNYVTAAKQTEITVRQVDARLVTDIKNPLKAKAAARTLDRALSNASLRGDFGSNGERKVFGAQMNSQNVLSQLDYYAKSATKAVNVLAMQIEKLFEGPSPEMRLGMHSNGASAANPIMNSAQSAQLVTQARQTISHLGSLLTLVTDYYTATLSEQTSVPEKTFAEVRTAKQALHGCTASLVMAIQVATDLLAAGQALDHALNTAHATEKATQVLVVAARNLVQEKDASDATVQVNKPTYDPYAAARRPSVAPTGERTTEEIMYSHDNDSDIEPDLTPRSTANLSRAIPSEHRARSDSQPSLYTAHTGNSGTYTPGTEYSGRNAQSGFPFPTSPSESTFVASTVGSVAGRTPAGTTPWYLSYDYQPGELVLNPEGHVKGGTITALIERLTLHDGLHSDFIATFLLTYRSFTNTEDLFTQLFRRFTIQPPMGLESDELEIWTEKKLTPIRLRVFNIIKSWLENYYLEDEVDDKEALSMIKDFSGSTAMRDTMSFAAVQLIKLVEKREQSDGLLKKMILNLSTQAPTPITPRNLKKIKFLELDPLEFARQLTIMEATVYNKIRPVECLAKAWMSEDREMASKAVNIKKMIETSNLYANWINELVLSEKELKKRVLVIRHLVSIAERLKQLNNFSMLSATMAALSQSPIHRLKRTWEQVPTRTMTAFMDLQVLMGVAKNWAEYRDELHRVNPPCVPFVGMYLTDLVMIQDGNSDFLKKSNHLINFFKRVKTAEVIREIQQYQSVPYCLTSVPEIQAFIRRGLDGTKSVADLYEMSLALEPREREDGKIARMLSEAGMF